MSRRTLSVERIEVGRMPGFKVRGFTVPGLSPGVTVIHGPNASGKTTLAHAVQAALWPTKAPRSCMVQLGLRLDEESWSVECEAGGSRFARSGAPQDPPPLPGAEVADRYLLTLPDLLHMNPGEDAFAHAVLRESAGGYDVMEAASKLGFQEKPRMRHNDANRVRDAAAKKREAVKKQKDVRQDERRLAGLEGERQSAREAQKRLEALELATEYAKARDAHEEAQLQLARFPQALKNIRGDEIERLTKAEKKRDEHKQEKERIQGQLADAEETLKGLRLPEQGVPENLLESLEQRLEAAKEARREIQEIETSAAEKRANLEDARRTLGEQIDEDRLVALNPEKWGQISDFARAWERNHQDLLRVSVQTEPLPSGPGPDLEPLQEAITNLRSWLRETDPSVETRGARAPLWAATGTGLFAAGAAGALLHPAFFALALVSIVVLMWGLMKTTTSKETDGRQTWQNAFQTTGQEPPGEWSPQAVTRRLKELENLHLHEKELLEQVKRRKALEQERAALEKEKAGLLEVREKIEAALGPAPGNDTRTLLWVVERALKWHDVKDRLNALEKRKKTLEARHDEQMMKIQEALAPYVPGRPEDLDEAEAEIKDLKRRAQSHKEAKKDSKHARKTLEQREKDVDECNETIRNLYERVSVPVGGRRVLEDLLDKHEDYTKLRKKRDDEETIEQDRLATLRAHPHYEQRLEAYSGDELSQERENLREQADRIDAVSEEINNIVRDVQDAKQSTRLEEATADHASAMDQLREAFLKDAAEQIGHLLARKVHQQSRDQDRPGVFHKARKLLLAFTHGRYRLEFDDRDPPAFTAIDTVTENPQVLDELSSATRLQLLLAVRLAFVEQQETGICLPMVLDETLANSDDERIDAIMDTVVALARSGRQVIYLTAQADEVAKWETRLAKQSDVPHAILDLAEHRGLSKRLHAEEPVAVPVGPKGVPGPDGHTHASYAETLEVPPFDPRGSKGEIHLWYLIEDTHLLHLLLEKRITTWGQLHECREAGLLNTQPDDTKAIDQAAILAKALEAYAKSWRTGRGRPVTRSILDASGAVSDAHIDTLTNIAHNFNGQSEEVLAAIDRKEVPRFRSSKRDELKRYLEEHGYLDESPRFSGDEIRFRVEKAVADALQSGKITTEDLDRVLRCVNERTRAVAMISE